MAKVDKRAKLAQLKALRKAGKKLEYTVEDVGQLYEEVDEDRYKKIVRDRLDQDDFVVDDNGEGYADDGREEWDRAPQPYSESEDEMTTGRGRPSKAGEFQWPALASSRSLTRRSQEGEGRRPGETRCY
jgi:DNA polymerase alpha subunit A